MTLKSEIWVQALLRRCQGQGLYGAVIHKGSAEAGAVFVLINHLDGTFDLLAPPPGPAYGENGERRFIKEFEMPVALDKAEAFLARSLKFDSDLWVVEIEDRKNLAGIVLEKL
jgi:hypothetical protein